MKVIAEALTPGDVFAAEFRNDLTIAAITRAIGPKVAAMKTPRKSREMMMTIRAPKNPSGAEARGNASTVPV